MGSIRLFALLLASLLLTQTATRAQKPPALPDLLKLAADSLKA